MARHAMSYSGHTRQSLPLFFVRDEDRSIISLTKERPTAIREGNIWHGGAGTGCKGTEGQAPMAGDCGSIYRGLTTRLRRGPDYRLRSRTPVTAPKPET